jgi:hypothetical protein
MTGTMQSDELKGTGRKTVRVVLADDHKILRSGMCGLLESEPGITVVAQAEDGRRSGSAANTAPTSSSWTFPCTT